MHEAVLPQSAREMLHDGDWLVPKRAGSPWLENPPFPQWVTVSLAAPFGRCDTESIARLGAVLMGFVTVFLVAWMASVWFGRTTGLLAGFVMATTAQFTRYSWLAEDEIFLCALVAVAVAIFVKLEFDSPESAESMPEAPGFTGWLRSFFGTRGWWVLGLFVALGMTNLAKGFFFGTGMAVIPMAGYLLLQGNLSRIRRYVWLWGWLAFLVVGAAWPLAVLARHPDAWQVWFTDLGGRLTGGYQPSVEPLWYYPQHLLWMLAPWTPLALLGLGITAKTARSEKNSPERFLWCWAILVPVVFSIPQGKNHHYLLHALAPWAILGTLGMLRFHEWARNAPALIRSPWSCALVFGPLFALPILLFRDHIFGPAWLPWFLAALCPVLLWIWNWGLQHPSRIVSARVVFLMVGACYCTINWAAGHYADKHRYDVAFLKSVQGQCTENVPLLVDLDIDALRAFLCLFYLPEEVHTLHNLSFLKDDQLNPGEVYLLTRQKKIEEVPELSRWRVIGQSELTGGESSPEDRLTLFRCTFDKKRHRASAQGVRISPMQSMFRKPGPVLR